MANDGKFINLESGKLKSNAALDVSTGSGDASKIIKTNSSGLVDVSLMPVGIGPDVKVLVASEAIGNGKYVNIYNNAGTETCRLADSSNSREAHGFVAASVLNAANATVFFEGPNKNLSGLTPGARQYLSTSGGVTATPVTTGIHQLLGIAVDATTINTDIDDVVVL